MSAEQTGMRPAASTGGWRRIAYFIGAVAVVLGLVLSIAAADWWITLLFAVWIVLYVVVGRAFWRLRS